MNWGLVCALVLLTTWREAAGGMSPQQMKQAMRVMRNACQPKTGVSTELIDALQKGEFAEDNDLKCYIKCVMGRMQSMKKGRLTTDAAINFMKGVLPDNMRDRVIAAMDACRHAGDGLEDACEIAYIATKCTYEKDPEVFMFP
ncbi:general odorant-binding protein 72-like [Periplaneta americana]|uniref:general odorant-binding protein 72-like n=1 Tax=Periplaneta americana TaxID=6978 RepID=UPI0037E84498